MGARLLRAGYEYRFAARGAGWQWQMQDGCVDLPAPSLAAACQIDNAAAAIAALYTLRERLGWNPAALAAGVGNARAAARLQSLHKAGAAVIVIDVAHNPQAAGVLAAWLQAERNRCPQPSMASAALGLLPGGSTIAVFGALTDKDVAGIVAPLVPHIAHWHLAGLDADTPRGLHATELQARVMAAEPSGGITAHASVIDALTSANALAGPHDRIVAFGSFFVAAAALQWARRNGWCDVSPESSGADPSDITGIIAPAPEDAAWIPP